MEPRRNNDPLEFDFVEQNDAAQETPAHSNGLSPANDDEFVPLEKDPTAVVFKGPERPKHFVKKEEPVEPVKPVQETPKKVEPMTNPIPTAINARKNIERQEREQRAVGTFLGSAATLLLIVILLVGSLAGFGGYVLWKQIKQQSVTISTLEANMRQTIAQLEDEMKKNDQLATQKIEEQAIVITKLRAINESQASDIRSLQIARRQHEIVLDRLADKVDDTERRFSGRR